MKIKQEVIKHGSLKIQRVVNVLLMENYLILKPVPKLPKTEGGQTREFVAYLVHRKSKFEKQFPLFMAHPPSWSCR